jgi:hypothetical protein
MRSNYVSTVPQWLRHAANQFWVAAGEVEAFPRRLEAPVSWGQPLAIFKIPRLCVADVEHRLAESGIEFKVKTPDRGLHGCLVAFAGKGIVFLDGSDPPNELRFSLAHEVAHFIIDYVWPRERAIERLGLPIVDVLDGYRQPTVSERIDAVLGDAPVGVHAHLMDRSPSGSLGCGRIAGVEHRADRLALELLAPEYEVRRAFQVHRFTGQNGNLAEAGDFLTDTFGLPKSVAKEYARFLGAIGRRNDSVRNWLGIDGPARRSAR